MNIETAKHKTTPQERNSAESGRILRRAFKEHKDCMRTVHGLCARYLRTPAGTPPAYLVSPEAVPATFYAMRKNLFSTLFMSVYHLLDIPRERRRLYGQVNYLFRIWVTAADNLLDKEDKVVVPLEMPGRSRVMRQMVTVMAADRVLNELLTTAVESSTIRRDEADILGEQSLRWLLPSAAQEAAEEGGIDRRPPPDTVLRTIHRYKTGLLFHLPFLGPTLIEPDLDGALCEKLQEAFLNFGLGCQLLDDIRDMARDLVEQRHNYVLSVLAHRAPETLQRLAASAPSVDARLYSRAPGVCRETARTALRMMTDALTLIGRLGLGLSPRRAAGMAGTVLHALDLRDLNYA